MSTGASGGKRPKLLNIFAEVKESHKAKLIKQEEMSGVSAPFMPLTTEEPEGFNKMDYIEISDISTKILKENPDTPFPKALSENADETTQLENQKFLAKIQSGAGSASTYSQPYESDDERNDKKLGKALTKQRAKATKTIRKKTWPAPPRPEDMAPKPLLVRIPEDSLALRNQGVAPFTERVGAEELVDLELSRRAQEAAEEEQRQAATPIPTDHTETPSLIRSIHEMNESSRVKVTTHNARPPSQVKEHNNPFRDEQKQDFLKSLPLQKFIYAPQFDSSGGYKNTFDEAKGELDDALQTIEFSGIDLLATINDMTNTTKLWHPEDWDEFVRQGMIDIEEWSRAEEERFLRTPYKHESQCMNDERCIGNQFPDPAMRHILVQRLPKKILRQCSDAMNPATYPMEQRYMCVMCYRVTVMWIWFLLKSQVQPVKNANGYISDYGNITGKNGEYILHQCIQSSSKGFQGLFLPVAIHCYWWYGMRYDESTGIYWYTQDGYVKPEDYAKAYSPANKFTKIKPEVPNGERTPPPPSPQPPQNQQGFPKGRIRSLV